MSSTEEREKARHRLRELAEFAASPTPPDSSGYVDLSAYSASDANWVEHALARAKSGDSAGPAPILDSRAPGSVAPVAVTKLSETPPAPRRSRRRTVVIASAILASTTAALLLVLHPFGSPRSGAGADRAEANRVPVTSPPGTALPSSAPPPAMPPSAPMASATAPRPKVPVAAAPARPRAISRPPSPSIPKGKSGGGDALTAAILRSIAAPSGSAK